MNRRNIQKAQAVMRRVPSGKFTLRAYQTYAFNKLPAQTEDELLKRDIKACFAGYLAVSAEFRYDGGAPAPELGCPLIFDDKTGRVFIEANAVAYWLDIDIPLAESLCGAAHAERIYPGLDEDVTPQDVVLILGKLLDLEYGEQSFDVTKAPRHTVSYLLSQTLDKIKPMRYTRVS